MRNSIWFLVSFCGFLVVGRGLAFVGSLLPGEEVSFWFLYEALWPVVAWLMVLGGSLIWEGLRHEDH